jgi:hypothetical protein
MLSLLIIAMGSAHAKDEAGGVRCEKVRRHGFTEEIVTYTSADGNTYALNGYARVRARSRHWINASRALPPQRASDLLKRGLELCKSDAGR